MIKFLILLIIFIVLLFLKLLSAGIGMLGVLINKRRTFVNYGTQYLKDTQTSFRCIVPYMSHIVDEILALSKTKNFSLADETELLQAILYSLAGLICVEELPMLRRPQVMPHIDTIAVPMSCELLAKYKLKSLK